MAEIEKISKEHLSLAGEYAVASELCKRKVYAQLTLGTRKKTDILVDAETKMLRIQVKAKQVKDWPMCKGISDENSVLVFVDYENKTVEQRPDFYILTRRDWEKLVTEKLSHKISEGKAKLDNENCPIILDTKKGTPRKGMDVIAKDISEHREKWEKIEKKLKDTQS